MARVSCQCPLPSPVALIRLRALLQAAEPRDTMILYGMPTGDPGVGERVPGWTRSVPHDRSAVGEVAATPVSSSAIEGDDGSAAVLARPPMVYTLTVANGISRTQPATPSCSPAIWRAQSQPPAKLRLHAVP